MNKLIKQLLENLFDDYDDILQDTEEDVITSRILKYDAERAKKWVLNNISIIGDDSEIISDTNNYVTITVDDANYGLNVDSYTYYKLKFEKPIPYYVNINKITCYGGVIFSSTDNLPKEAGENIQIESDETKFTNPLPQNIKYLRIKCPKLKSLEGINDNYASIDYIYITNSENLQDLTGLPDSVGNLSLENCNFSNLKGCPKQLNILNIDSCDKLENLIGCPESVDYIYLSELDNFRSLEGCPSQLNSLKIRDCGKLKSLKHISPLITEQLYFVHTGLIDLSNGPKEIQGNYEVIYNLNLIHLNAQDTVMTGHNTIFHCYNNGSLKELTGLPKMKYKDIKIITGLC